MLNKRALKRRNLSFGVMPVTCFGEGVNFAKQNFTRGVLRPPLGAECQIGVKIDFKLRASRL